MGAPKFSHRATVSRRDFIKVGALAGGGLLVGTYFRFGSSSAVAQTATGTADTFAPNVFIRIASNGAVSLIAPNSEMGQGVKTGLPMIVAEELDVPWEKVTVLQGDFNPALGRQFTVGSLSTRTNYAQLRQAGATARAILVEAAAQTWNVPAAECTTENGAVLHASSNRRLNYGELVAKASMLPAPTNAAVKDPKDFKLLGTRVHGVDNEKIVTGQSLYTIDVRLPGMLYAAYVRCPVLGGKIASANIDEVKKLAGVRDVFALEQIPGLQPGVAIVADSTWNAFKAAEKLVVRWDEGEAAKQNSEDFARQAAALAKASPPPPLPDGAKRLEAVYHFPLLVHAALEPFNATALFKNGVMELWAPTQIPAVSHGMVKQGLGLADRDIIVHIPRLGGSFGRGSETELEVAAIAKRFEGTPVKLTWRRQQDFAHDNFRTCGWHFFTAGLDRTGKVVALHDAFVKMPRGPGGMESGEFPFPAVPGAQIRSSELSSTIPTGYWRAPSGNGNVWAAASFVDELAHAAGRDPLDFTLDLLAAIPAPATGPTAGGGGREFDSSKMAAVVRLAAEKAGWGRKLPRGQGQGLAITYANETYVAIVSEVNVSRDGALRIQKLAAAVDAGVIINASSAEAQVQGAMLDGISAAWFQKITIEKGAAVQTNFDQYPVLRMMHAPAAVEVHFVKSNAPPAGLGEPGLPAAAPAVCNAIFAATGKRIRTLPFADTDLTWA